MRLLFIGPPGAGKGTQAKLVAKHKELAHISTGDLFREHVEAETDLGRQVKDILSAGEFVPDEITTRMLAERMTQPDAQTGYILDGFPRTIGQVEMLDQLLGQQDLDAVVVLEVGEEELIRRMLSRGRVDDTEETARHRMEMYAAQTEPLIALYARRGITIHIDGMAPLPEITRRILFGLEHHPPQPSSAAH